MHRMLVALFVGLVVVSGVFADAPPKTFSYQGLITAPDGTPIADGPHDVTLRFYTDADGTSLVHTEAFTAMFSGGVFGIEIGADGDLSLEFDMKYWITTEVDDGGEMLPPSPLTSAPYAIRAKSVEAGSVDGEAIADGAIVRSINGLTDALTLIGTGDISITASGDSLFVGGIADFAPDTVVNSINGLTDDITIDGAAGIIITTSGDTIRVAPTGSLADTVSVQSINSLTDDIIVAGTGDITVTTSADSLIIGGTLAGAVVQSLNGLDGDLLLEGENGLIVTASGDTIRVAPIGSLADTVSVQSINSLTDDIIVAGTGDITVTTSADSLIIGGTLAGTVVQSLNGLDGDLLLEGENGLIVTASGDTIRIAPIGSLADTVSVQSINSLTDDIIVAGAGDATVTTSNDSLIVSVIAGSDPDWNVVGNDMHAIPSGNVGVGTATPAAKLHVVDGDSSEVLIAAGAASVLLDADATAGAAVRGLNELGAAAFDLASDPAGNVDLVLRDTGTSQPTVLLTSQQGGASGARGSSLDLARSDGAVTVDIDAQETGHSNQGGIIRMYASSGTQTIEIDADDTSANNGAIRVFDDTGEATVQLIGDQSGQGRVITDVIEITGGSDLSETFDISGVNGIEPEPGMVVSIDSEHPGALALSNEAYDRRVAGVISGAGGVNPGMLMGQSGSVADGEYPVALTGRVYVYVDADRSRVGVGDLLTTSPTPGHAMRVDDHGAALGAILGKAMTGLESGRGLVLVLVGLQ